MTGSEVGGDDPAIEKAVKREPARTRARLTSWLRERRPDIEALEVSALRGPGATGFSSETHIVDVTGTRDARPVETTLVVRIAPTGQQVFREPDLAAEHDVMRTLGEHTDLPVPRVHCYEPDARWFGAPFFVMDHVAGRVPPDNPPYHMDGWVCELTPPERARVWWGGIDAIADVHRLDWEALGLDAVDRRREGESGLEQTVRDSRAYLAWVESDVDLPVSRAALGWLEEHWPDDCGPDVLSWGDARIGNIIFDDGLAPAGLLDWEMVGLGPPGMDLAWTLFLDRHHSQGVGVERLDGFPGRDETIARYETRSGFQARELAFLEGLAAFRFSIIMGRLGVIFREQGLLEPDDPFPWDNTVTQLTVDLLGL